jgi:hypothetical protein
VVAGWAMPREMPSSAALVPEQHVTVAKYSAWPTIPMIVIMAVGLIFDYYIVPIVILKGNIEPIITGRPPYILLPLAWVAGLFLIFPVLSVIYVILFGKMAAIKIKDRYLIYLNRLYMSVRLEDILDMKVVERRFMGFNLDMIVIHCRNGQKKHMPGSILDQNPVEIIKSINAARLTSSEAPAS